MPQSFRVRLSHVLHACGWAFMGVLSAGCATAQNAPGAKATVTATSAPVATRSANTSAPAAQPTASPPLTTKTGPRVELGIDVLAEENFAPLQGKRVGLLTHPAGVNRDGVSTTEVLRHAPGVKLVALYGPEHGYYGATLAGITTIPKLQTDKATGLPVYSLYQTPEGDFRRPSPDMLKGIDVMVVDLQDIGSRSYTFISCLRLTMEACFEQGKEVVVLDRPNPLGGLKVGGPMLEAAHMSYVGDYPVPYVFGLTIGELARMARETPGWLKAADGKAPLAESVRQRGKLTVIPMRGWTRSMLWPDTGLRWVPTSPYINSAQAAFGYAVTGLGGQIGNFSHGVGTPYPFRLLNFPGKKPEELVAVLNSLKLSGLSFVPVSYKDDKERSGVYVNITNWNAVDPTELAFQMMRLSAAWSTTGNPFNNGSNSADLFIKLVGSTAWWQEISTKGGKADVTGFFRQWDAQDAAFQKASRKWWLYPE